MLTTVGIFHSMQNKFLLTVIPKYKLDSDPTVGYQTCMLLARLSHQSFTTNCGF